MGDYHEVTVALEIGNDAGEVAARLVERNGNWSLA